MTICYYGLLGYAKAGIDQFCVRPEYEPKSPEPLISGDLDIAANRNADILHGDSLLGSLQLHKNIARSVSYLTRIRA